MPREIRTEADLPQTVKDRLAKLREIQTERRKDPTKLTLQQRVERIEKVLGL